MKEMNDEDVLILSFWSKEICKCSKSSICPERKNRPWIRLKKLRQLKQLKQQQLEEEKSGDPYDKASSSLVPFPFFNDDFPQDILLEIFSHLPVAFLSRVIRRVCNPWAALVRGDSSSNFAENLLQRSKPGLLLQSLYCHARFLEMRDDGDFEIIDLHSPPIHGKHGDATSETFPCSGRCFLDSCDGLALYHHREDDVLYLENPLTMRVAQVPCPRSPTRMSIPPQERDRPLVGISRDPNTGHVKLFYFHYVRFGTGLGSRKLFVLTLGTDNSWRKIGTNTLEERAEFFYEAHSLSKYICLIGRFKVLVIDAVEETTRSIPLSTRADVWIKAENFMYYLAKDIRLFVYNIYALYVDSGTIFHVHEMDIRSEMHRYVPMHECWNVRLGDNRKVDILFGRGCLNQELFFTVEPRAVKHDVKRSLFVYSMKTRKLREVGQCLARYSMYLHTNSLLRVPKIFNNSSEETVR